VTTIALVVAGYLAGSLPFGYWAGRLRGVDIRRVGSGNIGATNVWRVFGLGYALPVILLDVAKGLAPALVAELIDGSLAGVLAGGAAMLGHWRPLFLRFEKGGKTVATAGGVFFGVAPIVAFAALGLWIVVFAATRYASVASMVAALSCPLLAVALGEPWPVLVFASGTAVAVVLLHRPNIRRLRDGTENRFALRRKGRLSRSAPRTS
jgi:glycerol-3-phosphate acyltransferase PlsY